MPSRSSPSRVRSETYAPGRSPVVLADAVFESRARHSPGAPAGRAGVPLSGAPDAGTVVRRAHPAGVLWDRVSVPGSPGRVPAFPTVNTATTAFEPSVVVWR